MKDLILNVKKQYFEEILAGSKKEEYRLYNEYWKKRLLNKKFNNIIIKLGYPKKNDLSKQIIFPYNGFEVKDITHKLFGEKPVKVFSIKLLKKI